MAGIENTAAGHDLLERAQGAFKALLKRAGWKMTLSAPTQSMATALKLKATQKAMKVFQAMVEKN